MIKVQPYGPFKIGCCSLDEGEYVCSRCTVFGLDCDEVQVLVRSGLKMTDCNKDEEGVEVRSSVFKVTKLPSARTDLYLKVKTSKPFGDKQVL